MSNSSSTSSSSTPTTTTSSMTIDEFDAQRKTLLRKGGHTWVKNLVYHKTYNQERLKAKAQNMLGLTVISGVMLAAMGVFTLPKSIRDSSVKTASLGAVGVALGFGLILPVLGNSMEYEAVQKFLRQDMRRNTLLANKLRSFVPCDVERKQNQIDQQWVKRLDDYKFEIQHWNRPSTYHQLSEKQILNAYETIRKQQQRSDTLSSTNGLSHRLVSKIVDATDSGTSALITASKYEFPEAYDILSSGSFIHH